MNPDKTMEALWASSPFAGSNAAYVEELFEIYLVDPNGVPDNWRQIFDNLPGVSGQDRRHSDIQEAFKALVKQPFVAAAEQGDVAHERKQISVQELIHAYRLEGHVRANLDPLGLSEAPEVPALSPAHHGLTEADMNTTFQVGDFGGPKQLPLRDICEALKKTYCGSLAVECMHIVDHDERKWVQERLESSRSTPNFDLETKKYLLERLTAAEGLEKYLGAKYPGAKRFSMEGGDALLIMVDTLAHQCGEKGVREMVLGMAHRGRLNVLVNALGKNPSDLFDEFEGKYDPDLESGDVKYHQGFSSDIHTPHGHLHLAMAFNPSHLEIVTPVIVGSVAARQRKRGDTQKNRVVPVAIHGDSAFAGQGVVMEVLNMSQTRHYGVGGTVHIVVNNQVGFTTHRPEDTRSTLYCTDVAKMIQSPIIHVNADDPEAVLMATELALEYRMAFNKDVVIDLVCYRRHGHNEADEPAITQPGMYQIIRKHPTARKLYADKLAAEGSLSASDADDLVKRNREQLENGEIVARNIVESEAVEYAFDWRPFLNKDWKMPYESAITDDTLSVCANALVTVPTGFTPHSRVKKLLDDRQKMASGELPMDWGFAENMAYASLLQEGHNIRVSGQDCGRGTFSHRHAVIHDQNTGEAYIPLNHIEDSEATIRPIDSLLSEEAVLAFEYGYASTDPDSLVIWEAQFGDFANGAQVVIDQFISSGEQKWGRFCGLTLLLPHGQEGMGPEHSSARLERFLQLCAQHNIQVCVPSTPAQVFHMIRRQVKRPVRRPLVVMSPKSLLRHREAVSPIEELMTGEFQTILPDQGERDKNAVDRVVLCSGKVYYELDQARRDLDRHSVAIVRIEQLYPFPEQALKTLLSQYKNAKEVVWCQEEPMNQGAWYSSQHHFKACLASHQSLSYAGRLPLAAPAVGYASAHQQQQNELVYEAIK